MKTEENANEVPNCFCLIKFNESILGNYHPQPKHVGGFRIGNTVGYSQINLLTKGRISLKSRLAFRLKSSVFISNKLTFLN